jgi:hypothetical protein
MLGQRGIGVAAHLRAERQLGLGADVALPAEPSPWSHHAGLASLLPPAAQGAVADAKGAGGRRLPQPGVESPEQAVAKVG